MAWVSNIPCKVKVAKVKQKNADLEYSSIYTNYRSVTNAILDYLKFKKCDSKILCSLDECRKFWSKNTMMQIQDLDLQKKE
jgi:hypothetical protein